MSGRACLKCIYFEPHEKVPEKEGWCTQWEDLRLPTEFCKWFSKIDAEEFNPEDN